MMINNLQIETILENIKKQYPLGESIVKSMDAIAEQAIAANVLADQVQDLLVENDKLKTKILQLGGNI